MFGIKIEVFETSNGFPSNTISRCQTFEYVKWSCIIKLYQNSTETLWNSETVFMVLKGIFSTEIPYLHLCYIISPTIDVYHHAKSRDFFSNLYYFWNVRIALILGFQAVQILCLFDCIQSLLKKEFLFFCHFGPLKCSNMGNKIKLQSFDGI